MRTRLLVLPIVFTASGVLLIAVFSGTPWSRAWLYGLAAGALAGLSVGWVALPLWGRIHTLALSMRGAAAGTARPGAAVSGADLLEEADRTFHELSAGWTRHAAELAADTATLTAVLDGMAEGLWVTDAEGTIVRHNRALRELLGPAKPLTGERPLSLLRSTELNDAVLAACRAGAQASLEIHVEAPVPRTLAIQVMPLGHALPGSAAVFHDVTELRRLEKVRKDFVANVSHELRTPITAIRGYAETLRDGALSSPEHAPRMVEIIHRQSERLSALVSDLLELSRLEGGELKLERTTVSVPEVVARAAEAVRQRAEEKRLKLEIRVDEGVAVLGDARALEQVLVNLLDNAVKYTPAEAEVRITGTREGGRCAVSVRDTGAGIDEKHLARIFERFYRIDKGRSRETGGTGLGLSIAKHLTSAMGGEIRVQSRAGEGSEFTVSLPEA